MRPSKPQYDIITSDAQVNLFLAGQGAGKSHCGGLISYRFIANYPKCWGFIGANTDMQLSDSTLERIFKVWEELGIIRYDERTGEGHYVVDRMPPEHFSTEGHNFRHYRNKISFMNGAVVFIGSLENYKAHDGKEFAWAILDETKDTKKEAVTEVIMGRLRQPGMLNSKGEKWNPMYILTSPAKVQWLNEMFALDSFKHEILARIYSDTDYFKKSFGNKFVTISSSMHNPALPSNYIANQKANLPSYLQDKLIYANPFGKGGGEFYKCFDRMRHIRNMPYDASKALHISFDFNVSPYMTLTIWQVHAFEGHRVAVQIDEICLGSPKNTTKDICREFMRKYMAHSAGLFIYGDPSGKQQDTRSEQGHNDYTIIMSELKRYHPTKKVASRAPSVWMRGAFINNIFEQGYRGISVLVAEHCANTIADYTYLKEDSEGNKLKEKAKDPESGLSFERYGHTSDANDYFLTAYFWEDYKLFSKGAD